MPPSPITPAAFTRAELEVIECGLASVVEEHLDESPAALSALTKVRDEIRRRH
jgi:hypothetical protein